MKCIMLSMTDNRTYLFEIKNINLHEVVIIIRSWLDLKGISKYYKIKILKHIPNISQEIVKMEFEVLERYMNDLKRDIKYRNKKQ